MAFERVPDKVWEELQYEIYRAQLDYDNNWRAYRHHDGLHFSDWKLSLKKGCCGEFQTHVYDEDGLKWIVGCNYGH